MLHSTRVLSVCALVLGWTISAAAQQTQRQPQQQSQPQRLQSQPQRLQSPPQQARQAQAQPQPTPAQEQTAGPQLAPGTTNDGTKGSLLLRQAFERTKTARNMNDYAAVLDLCQEGLRVGVRPEDVEYADRLMSWAHNRRGEEHAANKRTSDALSDFSTAVSLDAKNWRAWHNRGVSMAQLGNFDDAISDFNHALELHKEYVNTWFNRAELYYQQGKFEEATRDYTAALRLSPRDPAIYVSRGHAVYRMGLVKQALEDMEAAIQLSPNSGEAWLYRGDMFMDQGDYAQASRDYRQAIRMNPRSGRAYQSIAWLAATCPDPQFRDPKMALDAANKAIEIDGRRDYHYLDTLAAALANAGKFEDAAQVQSEAVRLVTDNDSSQYEDRLKSYIDKKPYRDAPKKLASRPEPARK